MFGKFAQLGDGSHPEVFANCLQGGFAVRREVLPQEVFGAYLLARTRVDDGYIIIYIA